EEEEAEEEDGLCFDF
ncbi:hypothetical protein Tco_0391462, partial [Tanacetum coccineum]